jgi:hypothetical protein
MLNHSKRNREMYRILPQNEATRILERDILHPPQPFCPIALLDLDSVLVLLLPRLDFRKRDWNVLRELECRSVERSGIGFRQPCLVLHCTCLYVRKSCARDEKVEARGKRESLRKVIEVSEQGKHERLRELQTFVVRLVSCVLSVLRTLRRLTS